MGTGYMIWREMYGNGAVTGIGPTIIKHWQKIKLVLIPKAPKILMIRVNRGKKRKYKGEDHFCVLINIVRVTW